MTFRGHIHKGAVIPDEEVNLPEGAPVNVETLDEEELLESLREGLLKLAGIVDGLPSDMARNHDHYLYGVPKKS